MKATALPHKPAGTTLAGEARSSVKRLDNTHSESLKVCIERLLRWENRRKSGHAENSASSSGNANSVQPGCDVPVHGSLEAKTAWLTSAIDHLRLCDGQQKLTKQQPPLRLVADANLNSLAAHGMLQLLTASCRRNRSRHAAPEECCRRVTYDQFLNCATHIIRPSCAQCALAIQSAECDEYCDIAKAHADSLHARVAAVAEAAHHKQRA
jgi:hypothetical protein